MINDDQRAALAGLRAVWPYARIVLIGAAALRAHKKLLRFTADMDVAVAVDLTEYPSSLRRSDDWQPDPHQHQRWVHRNGTILDIIPAGEALCAQGHVTWSDGQRMSLDGFAALFASTLPSIDPTLGIEVATVPLIVLLKMIA